MAFLTRVADWRVVECWDDRVIERSSSPITPLPHHPITLSPSIKDVLTFHRGFIERRGRVDLAVDGPPQGIIERHLDLAVAHVRGAAGHAALHLLGEPLEHRIEIEDVGVFEERRSRREHRARVPRYAESPERHVLWR